MVQKGSKNGHSLVINGSKIGQEMVEKGYKSAQKGSKKGSKKAYLKFLESSENQSCCVLGAPRRPAGRPRNLCVAQTRRYTRYEIGSLEQIQTRKSCNSRDEKNRH